MLGVPFFSVSGDCDYILLVEAGSVMLSTCMFVQAVDGGHTLGVDVEEEEAEDRPKMGAMAGRRQRRGSSSGNVSTFNI